MLRGRGILEGKEKDNTQGSSLNIRNILYGFIDECLLKVHTPKTQSTTAEALGEQFRWSGEWGMTQPSLRCLQNPLALRRRLMSPIPSLCFRQ